jgi:hypothetical protein
MIRSPFGRGPAPPVYGGHCWIRNQHDIDYCWPSPTLQMESNREKNDL